LDRKNILIVLSVVAVVAVLAIVAASFRPALTGTYNVRYMWSGLEPRGSIQVSKEFRDNVIAIASNDKDVKTLLNEGYNVTGVSPIINYIVNANGDVTMKASNAILLLRKGTTGSAFVYVNVEGEKVTRVVTSTYAL
jgi:hypothetical protein